MTHPIHNLPRGAIHVARAEDVYDDLPDRPTLVISDGPYNMRKAEWDKYRTWDDFVEWYRPHVEAWTRVCADAATVYVWGTDDSASALRPLMAEHGWTKRVRVTWDKGNSPALIGWRKASCWIDVTEVCDVYQRGAAFFSTCSPPGSVWRVAVSGSHSPLKKEAIRENAPSKPKVRSGSPVKKPIHVSQKPLSLYRRMIGASTRPGDLVLEPFGGTCRAAVACESMAADDARRYLCIEPDATYVDAVLDRMAEAPRGLFGGVG